MPPRVLSCTIPIVLAVAPLAAQQPSPSATLELRNHHELPYRGPVELRVDLPDGLYRGDHAVAVVRGDTARIVADLSPKSALRLARVGPAPTGAEPFGGPLAVTTSGPRVSLAWDGRELGTLDLGLVVVPGTTADADTAERRFAPLPVTWTRDADGTLRASAEQDGYRVALTLAAYGGGWVDARAQLTRIAPRGEKAYVALVRRLTTPGAHDARMRFNGRVVAGDREPDAWDRDFWYTRAVDWTAWRAGDLSLLAVNGFTPVPTIRAPKGDWNEGSHFYVWERARRDGDRVDLVSEIEGPNAKQAQRGAMAVTPYAPIEQGDSLVLRWRLAVAPQPATGWEESQLRGFTGYRTATRAGTASAVADLGVPYVTFGTAYFPYSTLAENLDFYRTPGLDRETFWGISPKMWANWRAYAPRMKSDLRIARAMGFDVIRLHHVELLQSLDRPQALAFLDFFTGELRTLGLRLMLDTEGPTDWITTVVERYRDVLTRVELENEILIDGVTPARPARWTAEYRAAKAAAPNAQVFLTSAGNHGQLERAAALGVPFDRVGLHAYKHGPQWMETYSSHMLGAADVAHAHGTAVTLGEFNWKNLTELAPDSQRIAARDVYETVLGPRAIPEVIEFQFHETLTFNPAISGTNTRHYEPLALDRRLKVSGEEFERVIREYGRPDAAVRLLPTTVREARLTNGAATAEFTVTNASDRARTVTLAPEAYDGLTTRLLTPSRVTLRPGETHTGRVAIRLSTGAMPGTYHHFVRVTYDEGTHYGWGVVSNPGVPTFAAPVLGERVSYPQGADVVRRAGWTRPLAVTFADDATALELESAYQVAGTLQAATGVPVWLSRASDLPDSLRARGLVVALGTAPGVAEAKHGVVRLDESGGAQRLLLTGIDKDGVHAAAAELMLRFWPNAKDAAMRLTGKEPGNALGHPAMITNPNPP
ncbi:hypothetical protein J421_2253 [Gemmatirosa kalamazoonensis]|uniref:Uncharacterized protein n=1 Tax=Gemmatirosa kalamazoonensis TaxID=861299 RepID=W0RHJ1_9BACT|nr:hypothetical protein [Gemmatirosa kalamazoonensis]AHG89790.1 hypothetical protein J421_2253 [Gemmatirosa kalamazoonensis]